MKLNRKLVLIISLALSLALATGGTLAYLSDSDADVNVMTLGNVKIKQVELERKEQSDDNTADANLKKFQDNKPLYPYVGDLAWADAPQQWPTGGSSFLFTDSVANVVDKFVFVENTGNSPAYVRTWFAFEQGSLSDAEFDKLIGLNFNSNHWALETVASGVEIADSEGLASTYTIMSATYLGNAGDDGSVHKDGVLPAGETTRPSLLQVYLDKTATNAHVQGVDGNKNGTYDILVLSQAIQTSGFTDADTALDTGFGDEIVENHPFNGVDFEEEVSKSITVSNADEMHAALLDGTYDDIIGKDLKLFIINTDKAIELDAKNVTVHLNGKPGTPNSDDYSYFGFVPPKGENVTLSNLNVTGSGFVEVGHHGTSTGGTYTINNLTITDLSATLYTNNGGNNIAAAFAHYGTATLTDCSMTGATTDAEGYKPYDASFVNGTKTNIVGGTYGKLYIAHQGKVTITGAEVDSIDSYAIKNKANTLGKLVIGEGAHVGTISIYDFGSYKPALTIEEGATVDKIIYNGVTYTQAEWLAR